MSALPPNDPNQNPFTHQEVERWRKGHKPLPMSRDPDRERRHRRQSLIQDAIARVRATQHAYNAPDPPSKCAKRDWGWLSHPTSVEGLHFELVNNPTNLIGFGDNWLGLTYPGLRSNHDGPFMGEMWNLDNDQYGTGGNRPLSATTRQVTPTEVIPTNWLGYFVDTSSIRSGEFDFSPTLERFEEEARKRFKRERR